MRHGAHAARAAVPMRRAVIGVADEALGTFLLRRRTADRRAIGHHILHFRAGAVPCIHGEEGDAGQRQAHLIGVVRRHAGRSDLLQHDRLEIREQGETAADINQRLPRTGPATFGMSHIDFEAGAAGGGHFVDPVQHQAWCRDHGTAQEHRVGDPTVAEAFHHLTGAIEINIRAGGDIGGQARRRGVHATDPIGLRRPVAGSLAGASIPRRPGRRVRGIVRRSGAGRRRFRSGRPGRLPTGDGRRRCIR